ncbi:MAG: hypothetical protein CM1200mP2_12610 [Planctomycetaceae bacterium]|nr:MAG: hypothetical protein CM1200mP2_12610 [Planctomycetaceae bacterium]
MSERGRDEMRRPGVRGAVLLMVAGLTLGSDWLGSARNRLAGGDRAEPPPAAD